MHHFLAPQCIKFIVPADKAMSKRPGSQPGISGTSASEPFPRRQAPDLSRFIREFATNSYCSGLTRRNSASASLFEILQYSNIVVLHPCCSFHLLKRTQVQDETTQTLKADFFKAPRSSDSTGALNQLRSGERSE